MAIRIGIAGIAGRMGRLLGEEALAAGATLAGGTLRAGATAGDHRAPILPDIASLFAVSDVVIDFTHDRTAAGHAAAALAAGKPFVLGSSGLSAADEAAVATAAERVPMVYAANFAPGVNLFLALAQRMAAALPPRLAARIGAWWCAAPGWWTVAHLTPPPPPWQPPPTWRPPGPKRPP